MGNVEKEVGIVTIKNNLLHVQVELVDSQTVIPDGARWLEAIQQAADCLINYATSVKAEKMTLDDIPLIGPEYDKPASQRITDKPAISENLTRRAEAEKVRDDLESAASEMLVEGLASSVGHVPIENSQWGPIVALAQKCLDDYAEMLLNKEFAEINAFAMQRIEDKEAIGVSDYRRIERQRLEQIKEVTDRLERKEPKAIPF